MAFMCFMVISYCFLAPEARTARPTADILMIRSNLWPIFFPALMDISY
jgi:hypothetical protein